MRLQSQLNIAFTSLLIIIMGVTGYLLYSFVLDLLIQNEEKQLEQKGELLVTILTEETDSRKNIQQLSQFLDEQELQLFLYNRHEETIEFSSLSSKITNGFLAQNDYSNNRKGLWEYGSNKFVTSRISLYPESRGLELILLTPLNQLQAVQQNFIERMMFVFVIGGIAAIMLSYALTKRLVTPLSSLKAQLKQIENRQFENLVPVKAVGEIREVGDSVYEMSRELGRYIESQQTFFQNASHELKTPLMTIQGYAEGIRDGVFSGESEQGALDVMVSEVSRLKKIINEMTVLAKLDSEAAMYEKEAVVVQDIVKQAIEIVRPVQEGKFVSYKDETKRNLMVYVDEEKFLQALLNILMNGLRHAEKDVVITVKELKKSVQIKISDDGTGIPESMQSYVFHRFVKGKDGESGLGLAIARAIVEQLQGKIYLCEGTLSGAHFCIEIPIS